jgi:RND family efflux transporter MFP subunit
MSRFYANNKRSIPRAMAIWFTGLCVSVSVTAPTSAATRLHDDLVTVQAHAISRKLTAYGQIVPVALIKVRALVPGTLSHLNIVPGDNVHASDVLAELGGPRISSLLTKRREALRSAQAQDKAALQAVRIVRHKFSAQLSTRQRLDAVKSQLVSAHAAVHIAQARLDEAEHMQQLRSPVDATVMSVQAGNGEQTIPNETIATLLPANKLWLRAEYYGSAIEHVRIGMTGLFLPTNHGKAIPVKVVAIAPNLNQDTGRTIELMPEKSTPSAWINGQWGKLSLVGPPRQRVTVPTSALILDHGHWYVLLHTPKGDTPQQVIPGSAQGWSTIIINGLQPGQKVVVKNAFLRYHRGIARSYMPPD